MVPAAVVDRVIADLKPHLRAGDTIIDGGNSYYKDDIRHAKSPARRTAFSFSTAAPAAASGAWSAATA